MRQYFHRDLSAIATPMTKPSIVPNYLVIQSLFRAYFFVWSNNRCSFLQLSQWKSRKVILQNLRTDLRQEKMNFA